MAYYQTGLFTTANQFLIDLATIAADNGWTIDYSGTYNTSYYRVHLHKGDAHFDLYSSSATRVYAYLCTGYSAGAGPSSQPNAAGLYTNFYAGYPCWIVSTVGAIFWGRSNSGGSVSNGGIFIISDKIGAWSDGWGVQNAEAGLNLFSMNSFSTSCGGAQLYYNGGLSTYNAATGGLMGSAATTEMASKDQPNDYNDAILPLPIALFIGNATDGSKLHPIGYAPGVYRCNGGDLYDIADEIIIGSDTYLIIPTFSYEIGNLTYGDYLFKLGA